MDIVLLAARVLVALVFGVAGVGKLANRAGSWQARDGPATTTSVPGRVSPHAVAAGDDGQIRGRSCTELFGFYSWWLFSCDRQGPCGLGPNATPPITAQLSRATAALADGDDVRARLLIDRPTP